MDRMLLPVPLQRLEGAALLILALTVYWQMDHSWLLFVLLILAPDLSFAGYLRGPRVGAVSYNAVHNATLPALLGVIGLLADSGWAVSVALIWLAHVALDRMLGYGLKLPTDFKETHLGRLGGR